jgi:hyperosmotically inducible protein
LQKRSKDETRSKDCPSNECVGVRAGARIGLCKRTGFFCTTAADNTKVNQRDRNKKEPTADQQKENQPDREIARKIRQSIVQDKSLSSYAHNVKIIAENGAVTLKGPVRSDEEKAAVEAKAAEIAGADKVTSQLEVKAKQ